MSIVLANEKYSATLTAGYTVGQNTLSVSSVPDNVPTQITAAKGTDNETVFAVTGKTANSLTGVTRLRGANVNLDATTPITCLNNEEFINQYQGAASTPESLKNLIYAQDGGSSDDYAVSLDPAPVEYVAGMLVAFKANTANTGASTLNVNNLGAKAIKKNGNEDLADGDIKAGQVVVVVYDGTNFQLVSVSAKETYIVGMQVVSTDADVEVGDGKAFFRVPADLNGMNLVACAACVDTAGTTNTTDIQLRRKRSAVDADMLSTKLTIDSGETDSSTAATPAVIDTANDDVQTGDRIYYDVDAVSTTKPKGLYVEMRFQKP
jgi:hypothetical protein